MAEKITWDLRSVMMMGHVYARMNRSGGTYAERFAAGLRQSWAEEKAEATRRAAKIARWEREHRAGEAVRAVVEAEAEMRRMTGRAAPPARSHYRPMGRTTVRV
jgi:hypothetical protein